MNSWRWGVEMGARRPRPGLIACPLVGLVVALTATVAACSHGESSLVVRNRTTIPIVLEQVLGTSTLVVEACSERTIGYGSAWGAPAGGSMPHDPAPDGAYSIPLPGEWLRMPMEFGTVSATLLVTRDGIGVSQDGYTPFEATSGGNYPADPGSAACAGSPPEVPGGWPGATVREPLSSKAGPLEPETTADWVTVPCITSGDGLRSVQLWWRYRQQAGDTWGPWVGKGVQPSCPFTLWLDQGEGYYEFATTAIGGDGANEDLPQTGDAAIHRGPAGGASPSTR
jgi:hypothetical protein